MTYYLPRAFLIVGTFVLDDLVLLDLVALFGASSVVFSEPTLNSSEELMFCTSTTKKYTKFFHTIIKSFGLTLS